MKYVDYDNAEGLNCSGAKILLQSPLKYKTWLECEDDEQTPALRLGRLIHLSILQPDLYDAQIVVAPECDRRTKDGKEIWNNFLLTLRKGQESVSRAESELIANMSVSAKDAIDKIVSYCGLDGVKQQTEVALFKTYNGCRIKGRLDMLIGDVIIDFKSTNDASDYGRDVAKYLYHLQDAWYRELAGAKRFFFVPIEKDKPNDYQICELDADAIAEGKRLMDKAVDVYKECNLYKCFPGYSKDIKTLSLPRFAKSFDV
jgi:exodeoxyribonuclease VIII